MPGPAIIASPSVNLTVTSQPSSLRSDDGDTRGRLKASFPRVTATTAASIRYYLLWVKWTLCGWHHPLWHLPTDALVENHWLSHPCRPSRNRPQRRQILFRAETFWHRRVPHIWRNHRALAKLHERHPRLSDANIYHGHSQLVWPCKSGCELSTTARHYGTIQTIYQPKVLIRMHSRTWKSLPSL